MGSLGPVVIRVCDGARTEVEDLERVLPLFDELLETPADIAMISVFTHGTPMPDALTQRHAKESMHRYDEHLVLVVAARPRVLGLERAHSPVVDLACRPARPGLHRRLG